MQTQIERPIPKPKQPNEFELVDFASREQYSPDTDVDVFLGKIDHVISRNAAVRQELNLEENLARQPTSGHWLGGLSVEAAGVFRLDKLPGEEKTRQRYAEFLGGVAMHQSVSREAVNTKTSHRSSLDLLRDAAAGSQESRDALLMDTRTHVYEIRGGLGDPIEVELEATAGTVTWNGQTTEERQFHTLTSYPNQASPIRDAVNAEGLAGFRLEDRRRDGSLTDGVTAFDLSAIPESTQGELTEWGYFLNTMACCIRANRFKGDKLTMTSLFVGGVDERKLPPRRVGETAEEEAQRQIIALENRFDIKVLRKIHAIFGGENSDNLSPAQILERTLASPGADAVDMVMLYDTLAAEEVEGSAKTFFGSVTMWQKLGSPQQLTRQHYEDHMSQSQERQAEYDSLCQQIVDEQIKRQHEVNTPKAAVQLKKRVVLDFMVERAVEDVSVDASRLGRLTEKNVLLARMYIANGQHQQALGVTKIAKEQAVDPSCPLVDLDKIKKGDADQTKDGSLKEEDDETCNEVKNGDRVNCPYCKKTVRAIVPKKGGRIYCSNSDCSEYHSKK